MLSSSRILINRASRNISSSQVLAALATATGPASASASVSSSYFSHSHSHSSLIAPRGRFFSTANSNNDNNNSNKDNSNAEQQQQQDKTSDNKVVRFDDDEYDDYEPKTAGQAVAFYSSLFFRLCLLAFGGVCVFFTAKELFPGRMNPNSLFSEAFEYLQYNDDIMRIVGGNMKAFGRDSGRNTEGRRNHLDSYKYQAEDGSNRLRIRFNIKGDKGQVHVWAEVSDRMKSDEYVYVICQNARSGRVLTMTDKRDELEANFISNGGDDGGIASFFFKK